MTEDFIKGWFDCLNAVAIEFECDHDFLGQDKLINIMSGAGITIEEIRWAQEQDYETLNKSNVLTAYEGMCMEGKKK